VLGIHGDMLLPGYAGYPNTAAASLFPTNADVADISHRRARLVGYVHPFEEEPQPLTSLLTPTRRASRRCAWARSTTSKSSRSPITGDGRRVVPPPQLGVQDSAAGGTDCDG